MKQRKIEKTEIESQENGLPPSWEWATVRDICEPPEYGYTTKATTGGKGPKFVRTTDLSSGRINWDTVPYCQEQPKNLKRFLVRDGDLLISRAGSVGFSCRISNPPKAVFASYLIRFRPIHFNTDLLALFLQCPLYWKQVEDQSTGTAMRNLNASKLSGFHIPIPPLREQGRIAEHLIGLLDRIERTNTSIEEVRGMLKQFRQAVLAAACSGKLTEEWREKHSHSREWQIVKLSEVCKSISDGDHQAPPKSTTGIPFLVISDVSSGSLDFSKARFVSTSYFKSVKEHRKPRKGDILFTVTGSFGISVFVESNRAFCFQRHIALLRPSNSIIPRFLLYTLRSKYVLDQAEDMVTGTAQMTLGLGSLRNISISLPKRDEQKEMVRIVEHLFAFANTIEASVAKAQKNAGRIKQALLAKAFRGELVEQDPNDEPASVLLRRIKENRSASVKAKS